MKHIREKLKYHFDRFLSKGSIALIISLFIILFVIVLLISLIVCIVNPDTSFGSLIWKSLMMTLDAGNLDGTSGSTFYMIMMTFATIVGIFITSVFIGLVLNGFQTKLKSLSKGRSKVIESNHTLILGYNGSIFVIIKELIEANRSLKRAAIVVLCEKDPVEMNQEIKDNVRNFYTTRVICRTGSIYNQNDLNMCSIDKARSVILLENDVNSIKALLAISDTNFMKKESGHVSLLMNDVDNISVAKSVGKNKVEVINLDSAITRIIAQSSLQHGLSQVYNELLDFEGDEIYFYKNKNLVGKKFSESFMKFPKSAVIGLVKSGHPMVRPPFDTVIEENDELILIAADENKIDYDDKTIQINSQIIRKTNHVSNTKIEGISIVGFNQKTADAIKEYDNYLAKGSKIRILVNSDTYLEKVGHLNDVLKNIEIEAFVGATYLRPSLERFLEDKCRKVIIFANDNVPHGDKDSQTLLTLLHLREMEERRGKGLDIISEIADVRNVEVIDLAKSDDFIVSELLASKMLAQISENRHLVPVFEGLMDADGSEIYIKSAENYLKAPGTVNFYTVCQAAAEKSELAIGYIRCRGERCQGVVLNPLKPDMIDFALEDKVIVVADN